VGQRPSNQHNRSAQGQSDVSPPHAPGKRCLHCAFSSSPSRMRPMWRSILHCLPGADWKQGLNLTLLWQCQ
jgi:hypothetical protein